MAPANLRIALFSGNYNYIRDGANQALNLLVAYLLAQGASVRVYSPTTATPAFPPQGDLVSVPAFAVPGGREEYKLAYGLPRSTRRDLAVFAPNLVHVAAPEFLGHRATTWARARGLPVVASVHTRFETYPRYYGIGLLEPLVVRTLARFYNRATLVLTPDAVDGRAVARLGRDDADLALAARSGPCSLPARGAQPRLATLARHRRR